MPFLTCGPWIDELNAEAIEILGVTGREDDVVCHRRCRDQAVHRRHTASAPFCQPHQISPRTGNLLVSRENAMFKTLGKILGEPILQCTLPFAIIEQRHAAADLGN